MPFITDIAYGYPSYDAAYTNVSLNFIFANYGGSQGIFIYPCKHIDHIWL